MDLSPAGCPGVDLIPPYAMGLVQEEARDDGISVKGSRPRKLFSQSRILLASCRVTR